MTSILKLLFVIVTLTTKKVFCVVEKRTSPQEVFIETLSRMYNVPESSQDTVEDVFDVSGPQPQVQTSSGLIHGITTDHDQSFYGIPYARPPLGSLRFQPPQSLNTPNKVRNKTTQDFLSCYQIGRILRLSEDCLNLDIHVPHHVNLSDSFMPPADRLPVMFWIHGGAFFLGAGTWPQYEGKFLSEVTNTVIVRVNYRLGPFGFLTYEANGNKIKGNQGIKDQQLGLQWVQDNIEKFGGDKNRVTIFGESAGAQSVMHHLLSHVSDKLFHRAIMQSNPFPSFYPTFEESLNRTEEVLQFLKCGPIDVAGPVERKCCRPLTTDIDCLVEAEPQQLINAMVSIMTSEFVRFDFYQFVEPFRPIIDGDEFTKQPIERFKEGNWQKHKPIISGTNSEELVVLKFLVPFLNENSYKILNNRMFEGLGKYENTGEIVSQKYMEMYGTSNFPELFGIETTHLVFTCNQRALARYASNTTQSSVYHYVFSHSLDGPDCEARLGRLCNYSCHASDLHFTFRTIEHLGLVPDVEDIQVSNQFSNYWGGFARTGNPSEGLETPLPGDFPEWLPYVGTNQGNEERWLNLRLDEPVAYLESDYEKEICDFWDSLGVYMKAQETSTHTTIPVTTASVTMPSMPTTTESDGKINTTSDGVIVRPTVACVFVTVLFAILRGLLQ
uniref:crystal protein-like isoform X1 n=2 Tax=Styela clava TaxID=7725 RepID=UPI00193ACACC|nr:crystal protein-like isoform X1 [Styela clava]